ncbi:MAG: RluA family pseudouridine synthase [Bacteroidota bacterium]|nr:RluA family pseudouridine synthase [Bacteroidota bacterium]
MTSPRFNFDEHIIYNNAGLLVVNKPPFIPSLDERNFTTTSLLQLLRKKFPSVQLCHRLDRETSGIMITATSNEVFKKVNKLFEDRAIAKEYHAIVDGVKKMETLEISLPIRETKKATVVIDHAGKPAHTIFNSIEFFRHFTLLSCKPTTGRMHQIRVHLASQNTPITGDLLYGGKLPMMSWIKRNYKMAKYAEEKPIFDRVALHARTISFELDGEHLSFEAPYPKDLEVFLKILGRYDTF